jgi:hypothetical protein
VPLSVTRLDLEPLDDGLVDPLRGPGPAGLPPGLAARPTRHLLAALLQRVTPAVAAGYVAELDPHRVAARAEIRLDALGTALPVAAGQHLPAVHVGDGAVVRVEDLERVTLIDGGMRRQYGQREENGGHARGALSHWQLSSWSSPTPRARWVVGPKVGPGACGHPPGRRSAGRPSVGPQRQGPPRALGRHRERGWPAPGPRDRPAAP